MSMSLEHDQLLEIFAKAIQTVRERGADYKTGHWNHGQFLAVLFPDGLFLGTADDFTRFSIFNNIITKLVRYSVNFSKGGHKDSIHDEGVYAFILENIDEMISKKEQKEHD